MLAARPFSPCTWKIPYTHSWPWTPTGRPASFHLPPHPRSIVKPPFDEKNDGRTKMLLLDTACERYVVRFLCGIDLTLLGLILGAQHYNRFAKMLGKKCKLLGLKKAKKVGSTCSRHEFYGQVINLRFVCLLLLTFMPWSLTKKIDENTNYA